MKKRLNKSWPVFVIQQMRLILVAMLVALGASVDLLAQDVVAEEAGLQASGIGKVSEFEAKEFVTTFSQLLHEGKYAEAGELVDKEWLTDLAILGVPERKEFLKEYRRGMLKSMKKNYGAIKPIGEMLDAGGSYSFVGMKHEKSGPCPIFRFIDSEMGLSYQVIHLGKRNGIVRIVNIYLATTGELFSDTLKNILTTQLNSRPGIVGRLLGKEDHSLKELKLLSEMTNHNKQGEFAQTLKKYSMLTKSTQLTKVPQIIRLEAIANLEKGNELLVASEEFTR